MKLLNIFLLITCVYATSVSQIINKSEHIKLAKEDLGISKGRLIENSNMFSFNNYQTYNLDDFATSIPLVDLKRYTLFLVIQQDQDGSFATIKTGNKVLSLSSTNVVGTIKRSLKLVHGKPHILMYKGSSGKSLKEKIVNPFINIETKHRNEDFKNKIHIADMIIYDKILSPSSIQIQESALSMQYSISLPLDSIYYNPKGDVIFDGSIQSPYNHRVTAVGKYNTVNFDKIRSKNTDKDAILKGSINNEEHLKDGVLFWADNNMPIEYEGDYLRRIWKLTGSNIQNSNLKISFDLNQLEVNSILYDYQLLISEDDEFNDVIVSILKLDNNELNGIVAIKTAKYFTIKRTKKSKAEEAGLKMNFLNPAKVNTKAQISLESIKDTEGTLMIYTTDGQLILSKDVELQSQIVRNEDFTFTTHGLYFVSFSNANTTITSKIIIY